MSVLLEHRSSRTRLVSYILITLFAASVLAGQKSFEKKPGKQPPGADIFDSTNFLRIKVKIAEADVDRLNGLSRSRLNGGPYVRPAVTALVAEGNEVYTNVAIHLKGTSSFRPIGSKPGLTLNFDRFVPGQSFHGLHQITLNNSAQDPTYISERICRELFEAAGVPVPRANYAVLTLNGQNQGLYVLTEGYNKQFLRRYFKDVSGNLYEGGVLSDISEQMDVNSGVQPDDQSDVKRLISAVKDAAQNKRLGELSRSLDLDRFMTMIAMEIMLCHCDSYAMNRNNYRLYHDRDADRMIFLPHGMDRTFGIGNRCPVDIPLLPTLKGVVARVVLRTTEGREQYLRRVAELNSSLFDVEKIKRRVTGLAGQIRPVLTEVEPGVLPHHEVEVRRFLENIATRKRFVTRELEAYRHRLMFDTTGGAKIETWDPMSAANSKQLHVSVTGDGRKALHAVASPQGTVASWRAKAILEPGPYRFEGKAMTRHVPKNRAKGAYLGVAGVPPTQLVNGDSDWEKISCPFTIRRSPAEVEFVCELRGSEGEAWFDLDSLILWRVD